MPRRALEPEDRRRDAERTRAKLLDAAFDEFAAHGYAGARVQDIATRAGVNKQLITYYFGGKSGLYRALQQSWHERERTFVTDDASFADIAVRFVRHTLVDPRGTRLTLWRGLDDDAPGEVDGQARTEADIADMRARQEAGELPADIDMRAFRIALIGMVIAPVALPELVRDAYGDDPTDPGFAEEYAEQIRRILDHLCPLAAHPTEQENP
ncbi:TetR family transcriptional regulator [Phytomonospora sp. NPDC050363]|uniref:TetR/AcrR family transcriptional regulator n=1 Tax=Phytomonospora sp. NPDC050363 TaxID=3155642 RepID=UPI0033D3B453